MPTSLMNIDFAPLLALVGILLPIGFVYVILFFQSRHLDYGHPKLPATAGNELPHERAELSRAEKIQAVRLMKHWLF